MQYSINRTFLFIFMFIVSVMFCMAQNIGKIAILPFNGGTQDENDGIAELFSYTPQIMNNFTVIPRTNITQAIEKEQNFQSYSGMTDAETMVRLGNQFGASYVMAGSITSLDSSRLLIVSIVNIDVIQQVAGAFIQYESLDDLNKDITKIPKIAAVLVSLTKKDTGKLNKLAVIPVQFSGGANEQDGDALAQLLCVYLIQNGKFAVFPRTKTLEQVQKEYSTQMSGITRDDETVFIGRGINPTYVLSIASRKIASANRFNASIIDLEGGHQIAGESELYTTLSDGINAMNFLAKQLSGVHVSKQERDRRSASVTNTADAAEKARQKEEAEREKARQKEEAKREKAWQKEEDKREKARQKEEVEREKAWQKEEASRKKQAANDRLLENTSYTLGGHFGVNLIPSSNKDSTETEKYDNFFAGGGEVGLNYGYFGWRTGFEIFQDVDKFFSEPIMTRTVIQIPVLAIFNFSYLSPYAGIGVNLLSIDNENDNIAIQSAPLFSFIAGLKLEFYVFSIGYQYNRDFSDTRYNLNGNNFDYLGERHIITVGIGAYRMPFRRR